MFDEKKESVNGNVVEKLGKVELVVKREMTGSEKAAIERDFNCKVTVLRGHTVIEGVIEQMSAMSLDRAEAAYFRREITAESGGAVTSSGDASIYTELAGKRLEKFRLITGGSGKYSYGYVKVPLSKVLIHIEAESYKGASKVSITQETVDEKTFEVIRTAIWKAENIEPEEIDEIIPVSMDKYVEGVKAAIAKSRCYHCNCTHFY